ncbi:MAG: DUF2283 domain-containing protein [Candidatus Methanodesulfokora sp.]|jgi:uncharacterized protein YuzE|nr:MAG: hypothetical protein C0200_01695 [Candidatus Korarchaeota archaeon]
MEKAFLALKKVDIDYDEESDVLYISFGPPSEADDSIEVDEGVVYRLKGKNMVGITIISFKERFLK